MSELTKHANTLTKTKILEFSQEYYGEGLNDRASKGAMIKQLEKIAEEKTPLKPLPWEELLLEEESSVETKEVQQEVTDEIVDATDAEDSAEVKPVDLVDLVEPVEDVAIEAHFKPIDLDYKNGDERYMIVTFDSVESYKKIKAGEISLNDVKNSVEEVKSIFYYVQRNGSVLVRETRNSRFIELT